jgi:hypothetical protein
MESKNEQNKFEYENYTNNRNYNAEEFHQDGDIIVNIATSTETPLWAFSIRGQQVRQLMGCARRPDNKDSRIDLCYMALIGSLRSLTKRDITSLKKFSGDHVSIIVNSDCQAFTYSLGAFAAGSESTKDMAKPEYVDILTELAGELNATVTGNLVKRDWPSLRTAFWWSVGILNRPEYEFSPQVFGTTDKRAFRPIKQPVGFHKDQYNDVTQVVA